MSYKNSVTKPFCEISTLFIVVQYIQLFQKRLSERMANGECRTEVARPKGTVFTLFNMQNFISCVHLTWKWIHQLWTFVLGFLAPKTVEAHPFLNWKTFLVSSYERPIRDLKIRRRRRQRERHKSNRFISKTTILHVHHAFLYISLPSLHDYDVKMPNFTMYRGSTQATTKFPLSFWTWIWFLGIQL